MTEDRHYCYENFGTVYYQQTLAVRIIEWRRPGGLMWLLKKANFRFTIRGEGQTRHINSSKGG